MRTRHALVLLLAALALAPASAAAAPGWDPSPLTLTGPLYESPKSGPVVETTDDGAVWVAWMAYDATAGQTSVVVRRISPEGVPGEPRVLMSEAFTFQSGTVALAPLPGGDVRVAYPVREADDIGLRTRRLGPTTTGDPVPLLTATTGDGLRMDSVKLLAAPGSAVWATYGHGSSPATLAAARIPDTGAPSSPVTVATDYGAYDAAVNPMSGQLIVLTAPSNSNGAVDATRLTTTPSVESAVEVRAPQPQTEVSEPGIALAADGVATAVWRKSPATTSGRTIEARRISTVDPAPLSVQGSVTRLDATPGEAPVYPGPVVAADPGGAVLAGWPQWTTNTYAFTDSFTRPLPAGALTTAAGLASFSALTGTAAYVNDLVPGGDGTFTAHAFVQAANNDGALTACRALRLTSSGGLIDDHTLAATGCTLSTGPVSAVNGNAAVWATIDNVIRASRLVTSVPACDPVTAVTVQAGASVTVPLTCAGWRPARAITAQPARGTLGAIDDDAATVTYTAGTAPGNDTFTFRATNGAGAGDAVTVPITVTPRPLPPSPPAAPAPTPDTSAPAITKLSLTPRLVVRTAPRTPTLRFTLSEAASVTVTLERTITGRRVGGRCVPSRAKQAGARCRRTITVSTAVRQAPAGAAKLAIAVGKGGRVLAPGSYRVSVSARDAAGNASATQRVALAITAR